MNHTDEEIAKSPADGTIAVHHLHFIETGAECNRKADETTVAARRVGLEFWLFLRVGHCAGLGSR